MRTPKPMRMAVAAAVAATALLAAAPTAAHANTYSEVNSGCDTVTSTTTLYYRAPHGNFNLRVWVSNWGLFTSNRYRIAMYNNAGSLLWSASGQTDRTYTIGGNVTKITLTRESWQGAQTCWRR